MSDEIVLYYNPMSRARIAHWMLEEVGAPYRLELVSFDKREHKADAFLALNPMGKLPTLVHRGTVVTESAAICAYLADAFPAAGLAPAVDDPVRGTYYRWLFFGAGCVEAAAVDKMFSRPDVERPGALGYGSYQDTMNTLERAITPGPFLLGERFSAADVYIGSQIGWGLMAKSVESRPAFVEYVGRCSARPAFQRFIKQAQDVAAQLEAAS
ncbi:MAG: glutathione S-transferase family protein [Myxococcota bacterium]|nr:glutathione S-transferase family protein [Myxococcota bacterium]